MSPSFSSRSCSDGPVRRLRLVLVRSSSSVVRASSASSPVVGPVGVASASALRPVGVGRVGLGRSASVGSRSCAPLRRVGAGLLLGLVHAWFPCFDAIGGPGSAVGGRLRRLPPLLAGLLLGLLALSRRLAGARRRRAPPPRPAPGRARWCAPWRGRAPPWPRTPACRGPGCGGSRRTAGPSSRGSSWSSRRGHRSGTRYHRRRRPPGARRAASSAAGRTARSSRRPACSCSSAGAGW